MWRRIAQTLVRDVAEIADYAFGSNSPYTLGADMILLTDMGRKILPSRGHLGGLHFEAGKRAFEKEYRCLLRSRSS